MWLAIPSRPFDLSRAGNFDVDTGWTGPTCFWIEYATPVSYRRPFVYMSVDHREDNIEVHQAVYHWVEGITNLGFWGCVRHTNVFEANAHLQGLVMSYFALEVPPVQLLTPGPNVFAALDTCISVSTDMNFEDFTWVELTISAGQIGLPLVLSTQVTAGACSLVVCVALLH